MPLIIKRIIAYILDMIAVTLLAGVLSMTPLNPNYDKSLELNLEYQESVTDALSILENYDEENEKSAGEYDAAFKRYLSNTKAYTYKMNRLTIYENVTTFIIMIIYFVLVPYLTGGSTLGKKILGLRLENKGGKKIMPFDLLIRAVILYGIPFSLFLSIASFVLKERLFFGLYTFIEVISYILSIVVIVTTFAKKDNRGIHDILAKTKVVDGRQE